jgi:DNA-binding PadR family transcriptional regulator
MPKGRQQPVPALTPLSFHVLLALADHDRHGYGIIKEVEERTGGEVRLATGTLYVAMQRLVEEGLIDEAPARLGPDEDQRRRYYTLTPLGRRAARAEALRLAQLVRVASEKRLVPELRVVAGARGG